MPLYNYHCASCDQDFEDLVSFDTPDVDVECPECGQHRAQRTLSTFAVSKGATACGKPASSCGAARGGLG